jgi:hypothetical protein
LSTLLRRPWGWTGFHYALGFAQVEVDFVSSVSLVAFPVTLIPLPVSVPSTFPRHYASRQETVTSVLAI